MDEQRPPQQPQQGQVQIKADEKELQGQYSNLVMIHHNQEEFTLNFIYIFPNGTQGKLMNSTIVRKFTSTSVCGSVGEGRSKSTCSITSPLAPRRAARAIPSRSRSARWTTARTPSWAD